MARRSTRKRRGHDSGAAWISYSDMMAALLLLFVLVLCYSVYQYFVMLETKTTEIEEKAALLFTQDTTLQSQKTTIADQEQELLLKGQELADKEAIIAAANVELEKSSGMLLIQGQALTAQAEQLEITDALLVSKEAQLLEMQGELDSNRYELEQAGIVIGSQQQTLSAQQKRLDDLVGIRTRIIADLSKTLSKENLKATVDPATGDIMLESTVFFDVGDNTIKASGKELLDKFIPIYLSVLFSPEYVDFVGEIIIEGHTDTSGSYFMNLELSQERALSVAKYCLEMPGLPEEHRELLRGILTATGRSFSSPIYDENGNVDMQASRRVEFKFRLKDAEMIEEIRLLLNGEFGTDFNVTYPDAVPQEEEKEPTGSGTIELIHSGGEE